MFPYFVHKLQEAVFDDEMLWAAPTAHVLLLAFLLDICPIVCGLVCNNHGSIQLVSSMENHHNPRGPPICLPIDTPQNACLSTEIVLRIRPSFSAWSAIELRVNQLVSLIVLFTLCPSPSCFWILQCPHSPQTRPSKSATSFAALSAVKQGPPNLLVRQKFPPRVYPCPFSLWFALNALKVLRQKRHDIFGLLCSLQIV